MSLTRRSRTTSVGERGAIEIQPDARGAARAVVGHRQPRPRVQRQRLAWRGPRSRCRARSGSARRTAGPGRASARSRGCRHRSRRATGAGRPRAAATRSASAGSTARTDRCGRTSGAPGCTTLLSPLNRSAPSVLGRLADQLWAVLQPRRCAGHAIRCRLGHRPCRTPDGRPAPAGRSGGALPIHCRTGRGPPRQRRQLPFRRRRCAPPPDRAWPMLSDGQSSSAGVGVAFVKCEYSPDSSMLLKNANSEK